VASPAAADFVAEGQGREAVGGHVDQRVVGQDGLAGLRGAEDGGDGEPGAGLRKRLVVGQHGQDRGLARRHREVVVGRQQQPVDRGHHRAHLDAGMVNVARPVPDGVAEVVIAHEGQRRGVGQRLAVGADGHQAAVQRGPRGDDGQRADAIRVIAVVGQHVERQAGRAGGRVELVVHREQDAVVGDGVGEDVGEGLPVGQLVQQRGHRCVVGHVRDAHVHIGKAWVGPVGDGHDAQPVVRFQLVAVDLHIVGARVEHQHLVLVGGEEDRVGDRRVIDAHDQHGDQSGHPRHRAGHR
jgi:hypothetical protein